MNSAPPTANMSLTGIATRSLLLDDEREAQEVQAQNTGPGGRAGEAQQPDCGAGGHNQYAQGAAAGERMGVWYCGAMWSLPV